MRHHCFEYKGYRLLCDPRVTSDDRFVSRVAVVDERGTGVYWNQFPEGDESPTEDLAVSHGREMGQRWVDAQAANGASTERF